MKRTILLLLLLSLLTGCGGVDAGPTAVVPTTEPTPWVEASGTIWDEAGTLTEIELAIPGGLHFTSFTEFDGDLLIWGSDDHRADAKLLELCVLELDTGEITASAEVAYPLSMYPQVLGEFVYFCDDVSGEIRKLNKNLELVDSWTVEPQEGSWYMGADTLYIADWEQGLYRQALPDGQREPIEKFTSEGSYLSVTGKTAILNGYDSETGAAIYAAVDLLTGELADLPVRGSFDVVHYFDGSWLYGTYHIPWEFGLCRQDGTSGRMALGENTYRFTSDGHILCDMGETRRIGLYDLDGKNLGVCTISDVPGVYMVSDLIWNETWGGYFLPVSTYAGDLRLLFWDMETAEVGNDLSLEECEPIPEDMAALREMADELSRKYGVNILIGDDCDTEYGDFSASIEEDPIRVHTALNTLDRALSVYPEGFLRQLRFDGMQGVQFQLISGLTAHGSGREGGGYAAFAQPMFDHYLVVMDINQSNQTTYYHELSHVIDSFLESQIWTREDELYSEEAWAALNPDWFTGYSYDYSIEHPLEDYTSFIDSYSTVSPTEDRARVLEYAMTGGCEVFFEDCPVLLEKLEYYCDCIRDGFDTTGWPEDLPWEQYLYLTK